MRLVQDYADKKGQPVAPAASSFGSAEAPVLGAAPPAAGGLVGAAPTASGGGMVAAEAGVASPSTGSQDEARKVPKPAERGRRRAVRTGAAAATGKVSFAAWQEEVQAAAHEAAHAAARDAVQEAVQEAVQAAILLNAASEGNTDLLTALATAGTDVPVHAKDHQGYGRPLHRWQSTLHLSRVVRCGLVLAAQEDGAAPCAAPCVGEGTNGDGEGAGVCRCRHECIVALQFYLVRRTGLLAGTPADMGRVVYT
jgi:hypothetical protein